MNGVEERIPEDAIFVEDPTNFDIANGKMVPTPQDASRQYEKMVDEPLDIILEEVDADKKAPTYNTEILKIKK